MTHSCVFAVAAGQRCDKPNCKFFPCVVVGNERGMVARHDSLAHPVGSRWMGAPAAPPAASAGPSGSSTGCHAAAPATRL